MSQSAPQQTEKRHKQSKRRVVESSPESGPSQARIPESESPSESPITSGQHDYPSLRKRSFSFESELSQEAEGHIYKELNFESRSPRKQKRSRSEYFSQPTLASRATDDRLDITSFSQPSYQDFESLKVSESKAFGQLEAEIWKEVKRRMIDVAHDVRYCRREFHPIFTSNELLESTKACVWKLLNQPLLVSTCELSKIFRLRQVYKNTPPQTNASVIYYMRTFPIQRLDLESIIVEWEMSRRYYDTVPRWLDFLSSTQLPNENPTIYVRYIGMAWSPGKTAWDRYQEDLKTKKSGIMGAFMEAIINRYPHVYEKSQCHEILGATYPDFPQPEKLLCDDRERILIALFDRNVLLNQQSGGFYTAYTPMQTDHLLFVKQRTQYFDTFARAVDTDIVRKIRVRNQIMQWTDNLMNYAKKNPMVTASNNFPFTSSYVDDVVKRQAFPALIKGRVLVALFGEDVTIEDYSGEQTFLHGPSRAGTLTHTILRRIHQYEHNFGEPQVSPLVEGQFPFINLFPWIGHAAPEVAAELARQYFAIVQPRIVVTFSRLVSAWTASNFVHPYGISRFHIFWFMLISQR
jgi:hypothetical protein